VHAIDIPRLDPLEPAHFEQVYRRARRPVVLRGLVPETELRRWSFAALEEEFRGLTVPTLVTRDGAVTPDPRHGFSPGHTSLAEVLEQIGGGRPPSRYMMARLEELPAAWRERITPPAYCADARWLSSKVWLSPAGTVTQTHRDAADNLHLQLLGSKRFTLFDAAQSARLYPNSLFSNVPNGCRVDPEAPDLVRHPRFRDAQAARADLTRATRSTSRGERGTTYARSTTASRRTSGGHAARVSRSSWARTCSSACGVSAEAPWSPDVTSPA
jgi:hypothetical protein